MSSFFLAEHVPDSITDFAASVHGTPDPVFSTMETIAKKEGFPIIGPNVGAWLCQLARITDAERIFEFGSGFGYSACWFAKALPTDGEIVLTETKEANLDRAREHLERIDAAHLARFEVGDAVETARTETGAFDIAFLDIEKYQYVEAIETIREQIEPGGLIIADNVMSASRTTLDDTVDFEVLVRILTEDSFTIESASLPPAAERHTQGIVDYLDYLITDPELETTLLPLGDGLTVTTKTQ